MSKRPVRLALATIAVVSVATFAAAQAPGTACTRPLDPACTHLKCYQIKDDPITAKAPLLQLDNQFGREVVFRLQPVFLCVPTRKSCCVAGGDCSPSNCKPDPVAAPPPPHYKCYKVKVKTCAEPTCASLAKFSKGTQVILRDQFGDEGPIALGPPKMLCAPASKIVVGETTTTTTTSSTSITTTSTSSSTTIITTTTSTPTTTLPCHFDATANACTGSCPATAPPGSECALLTSGQCGCVAPPWCCECPTPSGSTCQDSTLPCPAMCNTIPNASCNASGTCGCGFCRDPASPTLSCSTIPCSASQPCAGGLTCDPALCPAPCDPCVQNAACDPVSCLTPDGATSACRSLARSGCSCCRPAGSFCTSDADCCSTFCNLSVQTCS